MALGSQATIAFETARLHVEEIKKQRLEEELAISRQIQLSLLPKVCPSARGWEFAATYQAAHQVGGDLYDFIQPPNQHEKLGLVIADVAGKGIPAALFMAFCRTIIRMEAMAEDSPAQVLERANQLIIQDSHSHLILTAFYALLNMENGDLVFANGGHDLPIWYQAETGICQELTSQSKLLGFFDSILLEERQIKIKPEDVLVFYTDGIAETRDNHGDFFGEERLISSIMTNKGSSAQDILNGVVDATNEFIGKANQSDDFTLIVIKRKKEKM
jgi:sigma-B regulation protein RsbU (phosphoserine phosphatase)